MQKLFFSKYKYLAKVTDININQYNTPDLITSIFLSYSIHYMHKIKMAHVIIIRMLAIAIIVTAIATTSGQCITF